MLLTVPKRYKEGFATLLRYTEEELLRLQKYIAAGSPLLSLSLFSEVVAEAANVDRARLGEMLRAIGSLVGVRDELGLSAEELSTELKRALAATGEPHLNPEKTNWSAVARLLEEVLKSDGPLTVTAKATRLMAQQDRDYCTSSILSDLRPVFDSEGQEPVAALGLHQLRLVYHKTDFKREVFSVSLSKRQLLELKAVIERAIAKDRKLSRMAEAAGLVFLTEDDLEKTDETS